MIPPRAGERLPGAMWNLAHVTFARWAGNGTFWLDFSMTAKQGEQVTLVGCTGVGQEHRVRSAWV